MREGEFRAEMPATAPEKGRQAREVTHRKYLDCREVPSESGCAIFMSGPEEHLLEAAVQHAVAVHGHQDTPELRERLRRSMHDVPENEPLA